MPGRRWSVDDAAAHFAKNPHVKINQVIGSNKADKPRPAPAKQSSNQVSFEKPVLLILVDHLELLGYPPPVAEYMFHEKRRWRLDLAYPDDLIALEYEGGVYTGGRHTRGKGFEDDCEKYNALALEGWWLFRWTYSSVMSGNAAVTTATALEDRRAAH